MTNACAAFGSKSKLLVQGGDTPRTFDADSERYAFLTETLTKDQPFQGRRRLTGSLEEFDASFRPHSYMVAGAVILQMSPADLDNWLPRILGAAGSSGVYAPGEDFASFDILIDRENGVFRYTDCVIAKATIRGQTESGQQPQNEELVELILYIFGKDETYATSWPGTEPAIALDGASAPYAQWEGILLANAHDTPFRKFELTIDNNMQPLFYNAITPTCFRSGGRNVTLDTENPFTTTTLADAKAMLAAGIAGSLDFTNGALSTLFEFAKLRNNYKSPNVRGQGEITLPLRMVASATASAPSIKVTNDSTV
jgi:hypothetical protein